MAWGDIFSSLEQLAEFRIYEISINFFLPQSYVLRAGKKWEVRFLLFSCAKNFLGDALRFKHQASLITKEFALEMNSGVLRTQSHNGASSMM